MCILKKKKAITYGTLKENKFPIVLKWSVQSVITMLSYSIPTTQI